MKNFNLKILLCLLAVSVARADDTEIFIDSPTGRAQVLIVFDTSGSMNLDTVPERPPYDPDTTYPKQGTIETDRIYWSADTNYPSKNSNNWMLASNNNCNDSYIPLEDTGKYQGNLVQFREWTETVWVRKGWFNWKKKVIERRKWVKLDNDDHYNNFECQQDFSQEDPTNPPSGFPDGYPKNDVEGGNTSNIAESDASWRGPYMLYTGNYLNWYHNPDLIPEPKARMEVAKKVIGDLVIQNTSIDFGLMVFNNGANGGRVAKKIEYMDNETRDSFVETNINSLVAKGSTPLCETMYEAYLYLSGLKVKWGDDLDWAVPPRDLSAESGGYYLDPELTCGDQLYIILMTDGEPTSDLSANGLIKQLAGIGSCNNYPAGNAGLQENCMPELAQYIANLGGTTGYEGTPVKTYTIGFNLANDDILDDTAKKGGGQAYNANTASELTKAFEGVFLDILSSTSRFTAPSIATNAFSRVRSIDDAYIASFIPQANPRWPGNLKKLRIGENTVLLDQTGQPAIDSGTGQIRDTSKTYWSSEIDGSAVEKGGAGEQLANMDIAQRKVYTDTGDNGELQDFDTDNDQITELLMAAEDSSERNKLIRWARGWDELDEDDDGNKLETKPWILNDILHSKPQAINYGAINGHSKENPDIRIVFGTNGGFLHMLDTQTGEENWAFHPMHLTEITKVLYYNDSLNSHPYGVDGQVALFLDDKNLDGSITASDKAIIIFGLRRGGNYYYAMDVTDPDDPKLLWRISEANTDFSELGQSWSKPQTGRIAGYDNPVAIFGAGYDTQKDIVDGDGNPIVGSDDTMGRGIFIVDLYTGQLVQSFTPASNSGKNISVNITDSIAAPVKPLDSDGDGYIDRVYAVDTGGNIWRADLAGKVIPANGGNWSIFKFAELGGDDASNDRRFHNQPDVLQTVYKGVSYDAVVIGSGDRPHPNEELVQNAFFMLKDTGLISTCYGTDDGCNTAIPDPIILSDLYDASENLIQTTAEETQQAEINELLSKKGWYFQLEGHGEKNLGKAVTAGGNVVFTTYTPGKVALTECSIAEGTQRVYAVNLHNATAVFWGEDKDGRSKTMLGSGIFGEAGTYYGDKEITQIIGLLEEDHIDTGYSLQSYRTHWYEQLEK